MVMPDGFAWNGETFASLSEIAFAITGPSGTPAPGLIGVQPTFKFSADSLPRFATMSKLTFAPSCKLERPAFSTAEMWTNTSLPPPSG
jgi:hypothetical protein